MHEVHSNNLCEINLRTFTVSSIGSVNERRKQLARKPVFFVYRSVIVSYMPPHNTDPKFRLFKSSIVSACTVTMKMVVDVAFLYDTASNKACEPTLAASFCDRQQSGGSFNIGLTGSSQNTQTTAAKGKTKLELRLAADQKRSLQLLAAESWLNVESWLFL